MRDYSYFGALFLGAALLASPVVAHSPRQDDDKRHEDQNRVYDSGHKDYHNWDSNEDKEWHQYLSTQHKKYRGYSTANKRDQTNYWNWRHEHDDDHR